MAAQIEQVKIMKDDLYAKSAHIMEQKSNDKHLAGRITCISPRDIKCIKESTPNMKAQKMEATKKVMKNQTHKFSWTEQYCPKAETDESITSVMN